MKKYTKRITALALTFALAIAVPFAAFTHEADAASRKTKYVVTSCTVTAKNGNGKLVNETETYTYYKNGLQKSITDAAGSKEVYSYNRKGYVTKIRYYESKGKKPADIRTYKYKYNKKGLAVKASEYGKNKKLLGKARLTYYKNGRKKAQRYISADKTSVYDMTFNKKGDLIFDSGKFIGESYTNSYSFKYDDKGNPTQMISTYSWQNSDGSGTVVTTESYVYTYDKNNNVKKAIVTYTDKLADGSTSTYTSMYTYKYKKVKVPKKYLRIFSETNNVRK